eukprot:Pgem_evm1s3691
MVKTLKTPNFYISSEFSVFEYKQCNRTFLENVSFRSSTASNTPPEFLPTYPLTLISCQIPPTYPLLDL